MADAFICDAVRTPVGRYGGALSSVRADDLAAVPLTALMQRNPSVDWAQIDDVILGCANQAGEDNRNVARMAVLLSGLPVDVPGTTVNRLCGSGLDALGLAARSIRAGDCELMLAGGVESMSARALRHAQGRQRLFARSNAVYDTTIGWRFVNPKMKKAFGVDSMPRNGRQCRRRLSPSAREDQDAFAAAQPGSAGPPRMRPAFSPMKSCRCIRAAKEGRSAGCRYATSILVRHVTAGAACQAEGRQWSGPFSVTAGNASGVNDGCGCACSSPARLTAKAQWLDAEARASSPWRRRGVAATHHGFRSGTSDAPGAGARRPGRSARWTSSNSTRPLPRRRSPYLRDLGLPDDAPHVNPNGGAIALGHPLGMPAARGSSTTAAYGNSTASGGRYRTCAPCASASARASPVILERV